MKRNFLQRMVSLVTKGEGDYHPGPWQLPITGGWLPVGVGESFNWWQRGFNPIGYAERSAMVEACVSAYSQTVAMCPGDHWRANDKGGRTRVKNSALAWILRHPNTYQSISDFMLNITRSLYVEGNAYALALRDERFEIAELHMMDPHQSFPKVAQTGDVFYQLGGNDIIDRRLGNRPLPLVPQRDVLHIRLHVNRRFPVPIVGESPIVAAYDDIGVGNAIANQQIAFYRNEARPSAVMMTDMALDKDQTQALRDRWNDQSQGLHKGGTPILTHGLKVQPWAVPGKDAATADIMKLSKENIALAFRIPLQILGIGGSPYNSTELLMQQWIATGLGFALNHIEEAFGLLFALEGQPEEYVEFDTVALLRSAEKDRIDALSKAVQGGIYAPNEARNQEGLDSVDFGDEPRVQQQVVPLSAAGKIPTTPGAPPAPPAGPVSLPKKGNRDDVQREVRKLLHTASRLGRRRELN